MNLLATVILVSTIGSYMELLVLKNAQKLKDYGIIAIHGLVIYVMTLVKHATNKSIFLINANIVMTQLYVVMECSVAHQWHYVYSKKLFVIH